MTARSERRAREMAVINAAVAWKELPPGSLQYSDRLWDLEVAIRAYRRLELEKPDGAPASARHVETSWEAAAWLQDRAGSMAREVYDCIVALGGATSSEVERKLGRPHQTVSARINQLRDAGIVVDSGERRRTLDRYGHHTGRLAAVWTPSALAKGAEDEIRRW